MTARRELGEPLLTMERPVSNEGHASPSQSGIHGPETPAVDHGGQEHAAHIRPTSSAGEGIASGLQPPAHRGAAKSSAPAGTDAPSPAELAPMTERELTDTIAALALYGLVELRQDADGDIHVDVT